MAAQKAKKTSEEKNILSDKLSGNIAILFVDKNIVNNIIEKAEDITIYPPNMFGIPIKTKY